jgi:hypothetical protein
MCRPVCFSVTPANAGVQGNKRRPATLDPGFRQDDDGKWGFGHDVV